MIKVYFLNMLLLLAFPRSKVAGSFDNTFRLSVMAVLHVQGEALVPTATCCSLLVKAVHNIYLLIAKPEDILTFVSRDTGAILAETELISYCDAWILTFFFMKGYCMLIQFVLQGNFECWRKKCM